MEVFHCFSTRSEAECGNSVETGMENVSPGVSRKRKLVIDLSISFNLWSITPTDLSGGFQGGVFARSEAECGKTPP